MGGFLINYKSSTQKYLVNNGSGLRLRMNFTYNVRGSNPKITTLRVVLPDYHSRLEKCASNYLYQKIINQVKFDHLTCYTKLINLI